MTEILRILITILGFASVSDGETTVNMISFGGEANSPYFNGVVLPGGVDTQTYTAEGGALSARYMLQGIDCAGDSCIIFIENQANAGEPFTRPSIVTDSHALSYLNTSPLAGKIVTTGDKLEILISIPTDSIPSQL